MWYGVVWCGVVWYGAVWCGVWCGAVWYGVVCCGEVWCGMVWCGVEQDIESDMTQPGKKSPQRKRESNTESSALEADALTTGPTRWNTIHGESKRHGVFLSLPRLDLWLSAYW